MKVYFGGSIFCLSLPENVGTGVEHTTPHIILRPIKAFGTEIYNNDELLNLDTLSVGRLVQKKIHLNRDTTLQTLTNQCVNLKNKRFDFLLCFSNRL